ncbi:MAG TPA: DUF308 domain-containing protein, partial [Clostridia bacterium]|nr:DUF308 domain-containing protein [Clostridia bacterium]
MSEFSRLLKRQTIIAALCYLALGLLFVCVPEITERAIALLVAAALLLFGIFKVIVYLARRSANEPDSSSLPTGTILALSGLVFLIKPDFLVSIVYAILGISLIVNGALKLQVCV